MDQLAASQPDASQFETRTFGDVTCIKGNCLGVMPTLPPNSVNMVFADLPYATIGRKWTANEWDTPFDLAMLWSCLKRMRKQNAAISFTAVQPFTTILIKSNSEEFKYDLVWEKGRSNGIFAAKTRPLRSHETILLFYSQQPTYSPQMLDGGTRYAPLKAGNLGKNYKATYIPIAKQNFNGKMLPRSVLPIKCVNNRQILHPTQKPVALLEWLIKTYTNDGDTILDPVAGSGTTAIAAINVGNRKVICIEKDPAYFEVMCKRIAEHQAARKSHAEVPSPKL